MFEGTFTALVSPFRDDRLDEDAFTRLIEGQIAGGITGIVPVGTTGESPTLDHAEHTQVIALAVKAAAGRVPVIAGTGSNATSEAVMLTQDAEKATTRRADRSLLAGHVSEEHHRGLQARENSTQPTPYNDGSAGDV